MVSVSKEVKVDITLSPTEVAELFWNMGCDEQALFLNHLGTISGHMLCFQLQAIIDDPALKASGLQVMQSIGEYANGE